MYVPETISHLTRIAVSREACDAVGVSRWLFTFQDFIGVVAGEVHRGRGSRGRRYGKDEPSILSPPVSHDGPANGLVFASCPSDCACLARTHDEVPVGGFRLVGIEPGDIPEHPFAHGTEPDMIERVHGVRVESRDRLVGIKSLPYGRGAAIEHIAVGWHEGTCDQVVRKANLRTATGSA